MEQQQIKCQQCGNEKISLIYKCPRRAARICPYTRTLFNVSPSFMGRTWLDFTDIGINIVIINSVLWIMYIVITGGSIFTIGVLALLFMQIRLLIWSSVIFFLYAALFSKNTIKKRWPAPWYRLQKQLIHYYRPADRQGFVAYERFGISIIYGTTAVNPIPFTIDAKQLGNYPPSLLALFDLGEIENNYSEYLNLLAQGQIVPKLARWTLLGLATQDLIQFNQVRLKRTSLKGTITNKHFCFVTPTPQIHTHNVNGVLEKKFQAQLTQRTKIPANNTFLGSSEMYQLIYNLFENRVTSPLDKIVDPIINDAISLGYAKRMSTKGKGFKEQVKRIFINPWHFSQAHKSAIIAEKIEFAQWDDRFQQEHPEFVKAMTFAVEKAVEARRERSRN